MPDDVFQFGEDTITGLEAIPEASPMIRKLHQICAFVAEMPDMAPVGTRKVELERLQNRLSNLSDEIARLSGETCIDLFYATEEFGDVFHSKYRFSDLVNLAQEIDFLNMASSKALEFLPQKRSPKKRKRDLAFFTACRFRMQGLEPTTYGDGPYMLVLGLLFAELFPGEGDSQHLRHGKWACAAIKNL